jgi:hypothetical protein
MLEIINAIVLGASLAITVTVLTTQADVSWNAHRWAIAGILVWTALIVAAAATGHFTPGSPGIVIQPPAIFAVATIALLIAWVFSPQFRRAMLSIPLQALVGLNVLRVLGVFFVLKYVTHELAAPFGPVAGLGDTITGLIAIPLAISIARGSFSKSSVAWWNAFGALDLFTALTLGALSQDGVPARSCARAPSSPCSDLGKPSCKTKPKRRLRNRGSRPVIASATTRVRGRSIPHHR